MLFLWLPLLVLHLSAAEPVIDCTTNENCECCYISASDDFQYQCPSPSNGTRKTLIHVYRSNENIRITCDPNIKDLDETVTPLANYTTIKNFFLEECPVPKGGFKSLTDRFNVKNLEYLSFQQTSSKTIDTDSLEGMESLERLDLENNRITFLNSSFFKHVPELTNLILDGNQIELIDDVFENTQKLRYLSICCNKMGNVPKNAFRGLKHLTHLFIWSNNISRFHEGTFDDLTSLEVLELMRNKLRRIEKGTFKNLGNLKTLSLKRNELEVFSRDFLENCGNLEVVKLDANPGVVLEGGAFSNFTFLKEIFLVQNGLVEIPGSVFQGSVNLKTIRLDSNKLRGLPGGLFDDLVNLERLHLNDNQLKDLDPSLFGSLESLVELRLEMNNLRKLDEKLLRRLRNLETIDLSYNKIHSVHPETFTRNAKLKTFSMSNNGFDFEDGLTFRVAAFLSDSCRSLEYVDLSYNRITRYPYDLNMIASMGRVSMEHNNIESVKIDSMLPLHSRGLIVNLSHNNISYVDLDVDERNRRLLTVMISNNPIMCDCKALKLVQYSQNTIELNDVFLTSGFAELQCAGPEELKGRMLEDVQLEKLTCPLTSRCSQENECDCLYRSVDMTVVANCSSRSLARPPTLLIDDNTGYNVLETEVHLQKNNLIEFHAENIGYNGTTKLYLGENEIENISWLPKTLKVLDLKNNNLRYLNESFLVLLNESKIEKLNISENPWDCDCSMRNFSKYLRDNTKKIQDTSDVRCNKTGKVLIHLNEKDLCPLSVNMIYIIPLVIVSCLFVVFALASFYFMYQKEILVWLYGRGLCLWLVEEEKLDKDKEYDVFVSYSSKDAEFVVKNLINVLEQGERPYKVCFHERDWIGGEMITNQIVNSVKDSRRTLIILSKNFLNSVWGKMEFRMAHLESIQEKRARVIIVIYGDIDMDAVDDELKAYLSTNTYIKWGDPWFWDKIRYALPRTKRRKSSQKHENIMRAIDEHFNAVKDKTISMYDTKHPIVISDEEQRPITCIA